MSLETNKAVVAAVQERAFNMGDLSVFDELIAADGVDHQERPGTQVIAHYKEVAAGMRSGFPDLHFEIHRMIAEGDMVAFHTTMSGTHSGTLLLPETPSLPPTGRKFSVEHMYFIRVVDGKCTDSWHVWEVAELLRQLGVTPANSASPE